MSGERKNGHGKGGWGSDKDPSQQLVELEVDEEEVAMDEAEAEIALQLASERAAESVFDSSMQAKLAEMEVFDECIKEYFVSEDATELEAAFYEIVSQDSSLIEDFVVSIVRKAMDGNARAHELTSLALPHLQMEGNKMLKAEHVEIAFDRLLADIEDISLDVPTVVDKLAHFIARAECDDVIPPSYIEGLVATPKSLAAQCVGLTEALLKSKNHGVRLSHQWGYTNESMDELKQEVVTILDEFFDAGDVKEVDRCVKDLDAAHFMHELVKRGIIMCFSRRHEALVEVSNLFGYLHTSGALLDDQIALGFRRVLNDIDDIRLDNPRAFHQFVALCSRAVHRGYLRADWCFGTE